MPKDKKECTDLVVPLPAVVSEVSISGEWIAERDELISLSGNVTAIVDQGDFQLGGDYLKRMTKTSNKLEAMRKEIAEPFRNAAELIKKAADKARGPLEESKTRLQCLLNEYAMAQARKAEAERKAIEEAQRKAIAEQAAKDEEARRKAEKAAADDPFGEDVPEPEPFVPVIPTIVPVVEKAYSSSTRTTEKLVWSFVDVDAVPRAMCSPDSKKVNAWIDLNKDRIVKAVKENPLRCDTGMIDGVKFTMEFKTISK